MSSAWWDWVKVYQFWLSFQKSALCFIFLFKKCSILFLSTLIFTIFLLFTLGFVLYFVILLGGMLGCIFKIFIVSWGKLVLLWTFPFALLLLSPIGLGLLCFHFHLFLCIFWFIFCFILWFVGYSEACCLASMCFYF